jgi:hypothetical protein
VTSRLSEDEAARIAARAQPLPSAPGVPGTHVPEIVGAAPDGGATRVLIDRTTVVVFASTTCEGCAELAALVAQGMPDALVVGVLRVPVGGLPDPLVDQFTAGGGRWVLGDQPFGALSVTSTPFFCVLDERGELVHEGVGFGRAHVEEQLEALRQGTARRDYVRFPRQD